MKKRMILALVLVFALLCLACSNDADDGTSSSESVSVAETSTESSVDSTSSADGTSGETSTESNTSSETSTESEASSTTTSADGTSGDTSSGTESSATSSDTSTSSKPAENSESSKPAENSKPTEGSKNSDTSSGSGNPNPSQTGHKHSYKTTVVKPTCTENGYTLHKCSCGDSYKDNEVPATGHDLQHRRTTVKQPTDTERGIVVWICTNPGCDYRGEECEAYSWNEVAKIEEECILYWVNKYRAEEGAPALTMSKKLTELDEYRAQQALQGGEHVGHNLDDISKAAEATKCGTFSDYTLVDDFTGEVITPRWAGAGQEAWCGYGMPNAIVIVGDKQEIDQNAKKIVDAFRASEGHWVYVGGKGAHYKDYVYVGIGVSGFNLNGNCYITVCDYNPDEKGYEHITLDENGRLHSEWVKD